MRVVFTVVASQQVSLQVASQSLGGGEDRPATKRNGNVHTMHNDYINHKTILTKYNAVQ